MLIKEAIGIYLLSFSLYTNHDDRLLQLHYGRYMRVNIVSVCHKIGGRCESWDHLGQNNHIPYVHKKLLTHW